MKAATMKDVALRHQHQADDLEFVQQLRLPGKAGKELRRSIKSGDRSNMVRLVSTHFRTRKSPHWSFYMHGSAWHETDAPGSVIEKADKLMSGTFTNSWPPHQESDLNG